MSTNYFKVKQLSRTEKDEIIDAIEHDRLISIDYIDIDDVPQSIPENELYIHIGSSSVGWKFCFDHNNWKYFGRNREEVEKFINDPSMKIIDEYGENITPEEFWDMVAKKEVYEDPDGNIREAWDNYSYETWEREENGHPNYRIYDYGFYLDGLRFSSTTDFR